jgi:hypothetical protein
MRGGINNESEEFTEACYLSRAKLAMEHSCRRRSKLIEDASRDCVVDLDAKPYGTWHRMSWRIK